MRIALVGGGSIAASFLIQLTRRGAEAAPRPLEIDIYDPAPALGCGEPYALEEPDCTLLNAPAFAMSALAGDKEHFVRWLGEVEPGAAARGDAAFLPRNVYGRYLRDVVAEVRSRAASLGWSLRHQAQRVVDLVRGEFGGYRIGVEGGGWSHADDVVLCLGNLPSTNFESLRDHPAFLNSPYPTRALCAQVDADASVAVLGTSLTAVDAIVALWRHGHRGRIHAVSRQGRLPAVRIASRVPLQLVSLAADHLLQAADASGGRLSWQQVRKFFLEDFFRNGGRCADAADALRPMHDPVAYLEAELAAASGSRVWLNLGLQVTAVIDLIWDLLDSESKREFVEEFQQRWISRRVTFPVENARILLAMLRSGQLTIGAGVGDLRPVSAGQGLEVHAKAHGGNPAVFRAARVVNATGPSTDVARAREPLVRKLLARSLAQPHPFGGFAVDPRSGCLLNATGAQERIAVLGSLACGTYFWTYSMDMNARLAARQAERLL